MAAPAFTTDGVSRGAAFGDLDNDGDIDIVISNNHGPARLYRNGTRGGQPRHWLGLELKRGESPAIGARVVLEGAGSANRTVRTGGSYASAQDPRILFGLGDETTPRHVHVRWPNGESGRYGPFDPDRYHVIRHGVPDR